jgi:DNA-binding NarL/FixJ family response regulator
MDEQTGADVAARLQRVLVVDDHQTFTDLLVLALDGLDDIECVGQAHDAGTARRLVDELEPDLAIMDVELGADDGIELSAELLARHADLRIVVLTAHANRSLMTRAADAGVCALLPKLGSLPSVLHALRTARRGSFVVDQSLLQTLITRTADEPTRHTPLSDRETDVLALMAAGMDARRAAQQLGISIHTFRGHVRHVLSKLDAHSQLEAVAIAKREGLLE